MRGMVFALGLMLVGLAAAEPMPRSATIDEKVVWLETTYKTLRDPDVDLVDAARALASTRLLLIELVGEKRQSELVRRWNDGKDSTGDNGTGSGTASGPDKRLYYIEIIYRTLRALGKKKPAEAARALASIRLLLIETVGEAKQREFVGAWNQ